MIWTDSGKRNLNSNKYSLILNRIGVKFVWHLCYYIRKIRGVTDISMGIAGIFKKGKRSTNEIYKAMMILNLFIAIIILIMGGYLYTFYFQTLKNDFITAERDYQNAIINSHENDLDIMNNIATQLSLSEDITLFMLDEQPVKATYLIDRLYQYTKVSESFSQVFYCYKNDHYLYNGASSIEIQLFLNDGFILENTTAEEFQSLIYNAEEFTILPEQGADGYVNYRYGNSENSYVIFIKTIEPRKQGSAIFLVGSSYYDDLLSGKEEDQRQTILEYNGEIIVQRGTELITENDLAALEIKEDDGGFMTLSGQQLAVVSQMGDSGIRYITLQPTTIFYNKFLAGQWNIFFVVIVSYIILSATILIIRNRITRKVRTISRLLNEDDDSFANIEKGIKALDETARISEAERLKLRRAGFINRFIRADYDNEKELINEANQAGLNIDKKYYVVALIGEKDDNNERKTNDILLELLKVEKNIFGYGLSLIAKRQSLFVIFGDDKDAILEFLEKMLQVGKDTCEKFIMAVSDYHDKYSEASKAYLEADAAYDNRFLSDNDSIICFKSLAVSEMQQNLPSSYMQRLKNAIRTSNKETMERVITEIGEHMQKNGQSLFGFRIMCNDIIHILIEESDNNEPESIFSVYTLSQCMTIQDFEGVLTDVCNSLMNAKKESDEKEDSMVTTAIKYISENYSDSNFNMSSLADKLGISTVTLSVNFKNEMDISPSDYLATLRMEKAKELLITTDKKIRDISFEVGYEDDHVFTRRFKKYTGKTPGQYRTEKNRL